MKNYILKIIFNIFEWLCYTRKYFEKNKVLLHKHHLLTFKHTYHAFFNYKLNMLMKTFGI